MAEASERPADVQATAPVPASPDVGSDMPPPEAAEPYRPLSLLAILGLALAVLYAVCVLIGGLVPFVRWMGVVPLVLLLVLAPVVAGLATILLRERRPARIAVISGAGLAGMMVLLGVGGLLAFSGSHPWRMAGVTWLVVGSALLISWLAWARIRESEGALSGLALARWGVGLSLGFGAFYGVYLLGNTLAVNSQAGACTDEYLELLRQGELPRAFLLTLKPGARPMETNPDQLRKAIEIEFNTPTNPRDPGLYNAFEFADHVQFLRLSGKDARFKRIATAGELTPTGYEMLVTYEVEGVVGTFELTLRARGETSGGRRTWNVMFPAAPITRKSWTQLGTALDNALRAGSVLTRNWTGRLQAGQADLAYLDTVPPAERDRLSQAWAVSQPLVGAAAGFGPGAFPPDPSAVAAFRKGRADFFKRVVDVSALEEADSKDPRLQKRALDEVRGLISGDPAPGLQIDPMLILSLPLVNRDGDRVRLEFPVRLINMVPDPATKGQALMIETRIVVEGPSSDKPLPSSEYRIASLRVLRALPPEQGMPGQPKR
jgi:hypothetical protein